MVPLSRRGFLTYGAASVGALALPGRLRSRQVQGQGVTVALGEPTVVHTYEEGVDTEVVPLGLGVIASTGSAVYAATSAVHGGLGWTSPPTGTGGELIYANPAVAGSSGSVYLTPYETTQPTTVMALLNDITDASALVRLRIRPDHLVDVVDVADLQLAVSRLSWTPGQRLRVDWRQSWDGTTLTVTVWLYAAANSEGWRADDVLTVAVSAPAPANVCLGEAADNGASVGFDTYREYDAPGVPSPFAPVVGAAVVHSFEEGLEGAVLVPGIDLVTATEGRPTYAAAAALHGVLGVRQPASAATVSYDSPYPPAHTGSLYVRIVVRSGAASRLLSVQNGTTPLLQLRLSTRGSVCVTDPVGTVLAETTSRAKLNRWVRVDWQSTWVGGILAITVRYFAQDPESPDNYTEATASIPVDATPDTLAVGSTSPAWRLHLDTVRTYGDAAAWPLPFAPVSTPRAPGMAAWSGDATQTTVEISAYTNATTSVGLLVSPNADLTGATSWPSTPPNGSGWNRWGVTGLSSGTQYYHQFTDTLVDGSTQLIGGVAAFRTLQDAGVGCTTRIAVGSCGQTTPTNPAVFDDMVAWQPDRTLHLGDFGYPNTLSRDPATHMDNWSLNSTDAGFAKIQAMACMDYIISDHDDNGTGTSNVATFNDPVTMASIAAWQQVVPARLEDVQVPPHGRWRSDVEGNVRYVKLDTRSIDKTDTTATPTDPRSPASTMLGATQLRWLEDQIDAAVAAHQLVLLLTDCAWNGTSPGPPIPGTFSDKWPSYIYERDLISDYAAAHGAQLFIVFGDSHGLQQDDGTNEKNGFASVCCGPLDQELHMHYQDSYQWSYPDGIDEQGGPYRSAQQYHRLTITQEPGSSTIRVTAEARDCSPVVEGAPLTVRTMTKDYTP